MEQETLKEFFQAVQKTVPAELQTKFIRVTPKGLFVAQEAFQSISETYKEWIKTKGFPEIHDNKIIKKLFSEDPAPLFILREGKNIIKGSLINCPILQPQSLKMSYFLGSLDEVSKVYDPNSEEIKKLSAVEINNTPTGFEFKIDVKGKLLKANANYFKKFVELADRSRWLRCKTQNGEIASTPLSVNNQIVSFVKAIREAKVHKEGTPILLPLELRDRKELNIYKRNSTIFVADKDGTLIQIFDLHPRNVERYVREEYTKILRTRREVLNSIFRPLFNDKNFVGTIRLQGRETPISWRGLASMVAVLAFKPPFEPQFKSRFTILQCLEALLKKVSNIRPKQRNRNNQNRRRQSRQFEVKKNPPQQTDSQTNSKLEQPSPLIEAKPNTPLQEDKHNETPNKQYIIRRTSNVSPSNAPK